VLAGIICGFGATKLGAELFLASWSFASAGHSDIAARGPWILALYLPAIGALSIVGTTITATFLARRNGTSLPGRLWPSAIGSTSGSLLIFFGADPTAAALARLPWPSELAYYVASAFVAAFMTGAGIILLARGSPQVHQVA